MKYLIAFGLAFFSVAAHADHDSKVAIDKGTYAQFNSVAGSSTTGTAFVSAQAKRMDALVFNNTSSTIWISTTAATQHNATHDNITRGIPVLSSASLAIQGVFSDALYFTCNVGVSACQVRVMEVLNR